MSSAFVYNMGKKTPVGCNFFYNEWGVRVQQAANTAFFFIPELDHATSLPPVGPSDDYSVFCQRGLAFVTSKRLLTAYAKGNKLENGGIGADGLVEHDAIYVRN